MEHLLDWYWAHVFIWNGYLVAASVIWMLIGGRMLALVGHPPKTPGRLALITTGPVICAALLVLPFFLLVLIWTAGPILPWLLDPRHLWPSLPIVAVLWLTSYFSKKPWRNVLAKSLQPWLIGMVIAEAIFFAASRWLPQSQWEKLFLIERISSICEVTLEKLSPIPLLFNLLLLAAIFGVNMWYPRLKAWTRRFEKSLEWGKSAVSVLAVFTSVTFFGAGQAAALHELTAQQKYDRLKDQVAARAQLILAARVTEDPTNEAADTKAFLNVVHRNVEIDRALPVGIGDDFEYDPSMPMDPFSKEWEKWSTERERKRLEQMVRDHVQELLTWAESHPVVRKAAAAIDNSKLKAMLEKKLTANELKDAKERFDKAFDDFIDKAAEISIHPLSEMLSTAGLPDLTTSIVKDLYAAQLTRLSKDVVDPVADALYRPGSSEANLAPVALERAWQRPVFEEKGLPPTIDRPTVAARLVERLNRGIVERAVREAVKERR